MERLPFVADFFTSCMWEHPGSSLFVCLSVCCCCWFFSRWTCFFFFCFFFFFFFFWGFFFFFFFLDDNVAGDFVFCCAFILFVFRLWVVHFQLPLRFSPTSMYYTIWTRCLGPPVFFNRTNIIYSQKCLKMPNG